MTEEETQSFYDSSMILSPEEQAIIEQYTGRDSSMPNTKDNLFTFLKNIIKSKDTTKTAFLKDEELGNALVDVRTYQRIAVFCDMVANKKAIGRYYDKKAEIINRTSLGREGFLVNKSVISRKQFEDVTRPKKENKGWFKKKEDVQQLQT